MPKLPIKKIIGDRQERCLYCSGTKIIRKGKRRKKFETVQLWYCKDCDTVFAPRELKGKTYPIPVILDGHQEPDAFVLRRPALNGAGCLHETR